MSTQLPNGAKKASSHLRTNAIFKLYDAMTIDGPGPPAAS